MSKASDNLPVYPNAKKKISLIRSWVKYETPDPIQVVDEFYRHSFPEPRWEIILDKEPYIFTYPNGKTMTMKEVEYLKKGAFAIYISIARIEDVTRIHADTNIQLCPFSVGDLVRFVPPRGKARPLTDEISRGDIRRVERIKNELWIQAEACSRYFPWSFFERIPQKNIPLA